MNSQEFVIWLKGFTEGVHDFNVTPKQWDIMKEKLADVSDDKFVEPPGMFQVHPQPPYPGTSIGPYGTGTPNTVSIPSVWTTNPNSNTFTVTSGSSYSGPVTYTYPNGTTVSYTTGGANEFDEPKDKTLLHD
jgi:hypothetical protein